MKTSFEVVTPYWLITRRLPFVKEFPGRKTVKTLKVFVLTLTIYFDANDPAATPGPRLWQAVLTFIRFFHDIMKYFVIS